MIRPLAIAAIAATATFALPANADPVLGTWQTEPGDSGNTAHIRMYACGAKICGVLERAYNPSGQQIPSDSEGTRMIWDMTTKGDGAYTGGRIFAPDSGKTYRSKMAISGDRLTVSGCIGPICGGQIWTRVD